MNNISTNHRVFTGCIEQLSEPVKFTVETTGSDDFKSYSAKLNHQILGDADAYFSKPDESSCHTFLSFLINKTDNIKYKIHGVGTALIERVIEDSIKIDQGRIKLNSYAEALAFYWKLGFRLEEKQNIRTRKTVRLVQKLQEQRSWAT